MIAFPSNPTLNDTYPPLDQPAINGGRRWKFNGTAWDALPIPPAWDDLTGKPTEFPVESHTHEVSEVTGLQDALDGLQPAGDYATLDGDGKVPASQLPSYVDDVLEFADLAGFPATGESAKIYVDLATSKTYRWSGSVYIEISASPGSTDAVAEGSLNLYYTDMRASAAAPVQTVAGKTGTVTLAPSDIVGLDTALSGAGAMSVNFTVKAVSQGSYSDGNTIPAGTSLEAVIKNMLQQRVPAAYASPTLSLSSATTLNPEIGTNVSASLVSNWNKGDAGDATQFRVNQDGVLVQTTNGSTPGNYSASFQLLANTSFSAEADYQQGAQKYDNLGDASGTPVAAGTRTSSALSFTPRRASFYGADTGTSAASTSATIRLLGNSVLGHANGSTFTLNIPAGSTRVSIAYPATLRALNSAKYVEVGNSEVKDTFTETSVSVEGANGASPTNYRVYTYRPSIPFGSAATYTVTI
jgi:hypothetical protein